MVINGALLLGTFFFQAYLVRGASIRGALLLGTIRYMLILHVAVNILCIKYFYTIILERVSEQRI